MSMLNEFISYLEKQVGQPYLWGGQHTKLTPSNYISVINAKEHKDGKDRGKYADGTTYANAAIAFCKKKFDAGATVLYAYDCSGLGCYWLYNLKKLYKGDINANTMMNRCEIVDTEPKKGYWVFRLDGSKASHIGYMIDDEYLIEAKGRKYGVVKTKFKAKDWDRWGIPKVFEEEIQNAEEVVETDTSSGNPVEKDKYQFNTEDSIRIVHVIAKQVKVRKSDARVNGKLVGKFIFTARKGNTFRLIDVAPSGWYHIETYKGPAYISNRKDLTELLYRVRLKPEKDIDLGQTIF